jgi:hypothetical protein
MHLRRALLLFAIVLGLAALAASLSRPSRKSGETAPTTSQELPLLAPGPTAESSARARFSEAGRRRTRTVPVRRAAVVTVEVERPGQVELRGLGLTASAEPSTPARFDVLAGVAGRHEVRFTPASGSRPQTVGVLRIVRPARGPS